MTFRWYFNNAANNKAASMAYDHSVEAIAEYLIMTGWVSEKAAWAIAYQSKRAITAKRYSKSASTKHRAV